MGIIEQKANQIAADMAQTESIKKYAIDPFTILTIVEILIELVDLYRKCRKAKQETAQSMQDPGMVERWRLRKVIRTKVDDSEAHQILGNRIFQSTLNVGKTVTEDEVGQMYDELDHRGMV